MQNAQTTNFVVQTLRHFVREEQGPPPGIPAHATAEFDRALTWLCEWHGVTPIVVASLAKLALPPQLSRINLERVRALASATGNINTDLAATATTLAEKFQDKGAEVLWMDDLALAGTLYPELGLRPVERLAVMIREDDWAKVIAASAEAGFQQPDDAPVCRDGREALDFYQHFSPCVLRSSGGDLLELRFRTFDTGRAEENEIAWQRGAVIEDGVRRLGFEDQLIRTCAAFAMTRLGKYLYATDIGLILNRHGSKLDWDYITWRLRARGTYPAVYFALQRAIDLLKLNQWTQQLPYPGTLQRKRFYFLWDNVTPGAASDQPPFHRLRYHLLESGSVRDRIRFVRRLMTPRREWVSSATGRPYRPWHKARFIISSLRGRVPLT